MKKILIILVTILLSTNCGYSAVEFEFEKNGLEVHISNVSDVFYSQSQTNLGDPRVFLIPKSESLEKAMAFSVAVPRGTAFDTKIIVHKYNNIVNPNSASSQFSHIETVSLGIRRGVEIFSIRVYPENLTNDKSEIADSITISIKFSKDFPIYAKYDLPSYVRSFFSDVVNSQQIPGMMVRNKSMDKVLSGDSWYDKSKDYVKVTTKHDGVAEINVIDLLGIKPEWAGAAAAGLHLLHNGEDYPIYIESSTGSLSVASKIYFLGKRASGDSTWLDNYTDQAAFYLFYDAGKQASRLGTISEPASGTKTESVSIDYHLEEDTDYFLGTVNIYPRTDYLEGWYFAKLHRITHDWEAQLYQYSGNINLLPNLGDELDIRIKYSTLCNAKEHENNIELKGSDPRNLYLFNFLLNNDSISNTSLNKWTEDFLIAKRSGESLFAGANRLRVINRRMDTSNGLLGLDYITIKGKAKPLPLKGKAQFNLTGSSNDISVSVPGFNASKLTYIDTLSKSIGFKSGIEGYRFAASAGTNIDSALVIVLNDTIVRFNNTGFAYAYKSVNSEPIVKFEQYSFNADNIINEFNALPTGSIILIATNTNSALSSQLRSYFQSLGSTTVQSLANGNGWVLAAVKGNLSIFEKLSQSGISSIDGFIPQAQAGHYSFDINFEKNKDLVLYLNSDNAIEQAELMKVHQSDLKNVDNSADLIIITHSKFSEPAHDIAEYRTGKGHQVLVVDVEDIYKEYGFGRKSPHTIKAFLSFAYSNWTGKKPEYLLIVGDASWDGRKVIPGTRGNNYVPSFGQPVSDLWYGYLEGDDFEPEILMGRIPAQEVEEVYNYFEKVVSFENQPPMPWMKSFLYLSGGLDAGERSTFRYHRWDVFDYVQPYPLCADTASVSKKDNNAGSEEEMSTILGHLNKGVVWTTFFGHSSTQVFDMDGWHVEYMNNKDKCGFLSTLSCNTGAFAEPLDLHGRNEKYILAKDKGFVAAYGSTGVGFAEGAFTVLPRMTEAVSDKSIALRRAGDILNYSRAFLVDNNFQHLATKQLMHLLGDPLVKLRIGIEPDLFFVPNEIQFTSSGEEPANPTESDEFINISGRVYNNGYTAENPLKVRLITTYNSVIDTLFFDINGVCNKADFSFKLPIKNLPGEHKVDFLVFGDDFEDFDYSNNSFTSSFYVYSQNLLPVDPLSNWNASAKTPQFRFINPLSDKFDFEYNFEIYELTGNDTLFVYRAVNSEILITETHIDWNPSIELTLGKSYFISAVSKNITNNTESFPLIIPFFAGNPISNTVTQKFSQKTDFSGFELNGLMVEDNPAGISIFNPEIEFTALSVNGDPTPANEFLSWGRISLGNDVYFDSQFSRGFNVVIIPKNDLTHTARYERFDTWEYVEDAENFVRLLRDTITPDQYVIIATCGQSFRAFVDLLPNTHIGSIDSLRSTLELYGVENADLLTYGKSFAYAGFKGALPGQKFESINEFDTAYVSGNFKFYGQRGSGISTIIGPAKNWNNLIITGSIDENSATKNIGMNFHNAGRTKDTLVPIENFGTTNIAHISGLTYPFAEIIFELEKNSVEAECSINSIAVDFSPVPEFAMVKSKTSFGTPEVLRGDTAHFQFEIENISLRTDADSCKISNEIVDLQSNSKTVEYVSPSISKNNSILFKTDISTSDYNTEIRSIARIVPVDYELYSFNNSTEKSLIIVEDTIKPTVIVRFDGRQVHDGDYISSTPEISVELFDNSLLPITNSQDILLRLNGAMITESNTTEYKFDSYGAQVPLKASLFAVPDSTLKETDNSLFVYFSDASSNKDTFRMILKIATKGKIVNHRIAPNPTYDNSKFMFDVQSPRKDGKAVIEIYNITGSLVKEIESPIDLGSNVILWNNRDGEGNLLAPGMYYYRIRVNETVIFEPAVGKFVVIR